jgi:twitching motility two-component system response regulator PilH
MNKILIVEDSNTDRALIKKILEKRNYNIIESDHGNEVDQIIRDNSPDLILLDIVLPEISGYEICRNIKKNEYSKSIPVILISVKDKSSDIFWGKKQGADEYLTKPIEPNVLLEIVDKYLDGK